MSVPTVDEPDASEWPSTADREDWLHWPTLVEIRTAGGGDKGLRTTIDRYFRASGRRLRFAGATDSQKGRRADGDNDER